MVQGASRDGRKAPFAPRSALASKSCLPGNREAQGCAGCTSPRQHPDDRECLHAADRAERSESDELAHDGDPRWLEAGLVCSNARNGYGRRGNEAKNAQPGAELGPSWTKIGRDGCKPFAEVGPKWTKRRREGSCKCLKRLAPQVGLEPTTLRLTAECSAILPFRFAWIEHFLRAPIG
jgi:hypothetical protein